MYLFQRKENKSSAECSIYTGRDLSVKYVKTTPTKALSLKLTIQKVWFLNTLKYHLNKGNSPHMKERPKV